MVRRTSIGVGIAIWIAVVALAVGGRTAGADSSGRPLYGFRNGAGLMATLSTAGDLDLQNPFFQDLGTNGRRCVSCHQPDSAWGISAENVQRRFEATKGADPIFTNNDGSDCEGVEPRSVAAKRRAYSLLLSRGLIRVGLDVPSGAEFVIDRIRDPYHCGPASTDTSLYRRPLPAANLKFLSAVMWDGRESSASTTVLQDLAKQANDATQGHAAGNPLTAAQAQEIVDFETSLYAAQFRDDRAGSLTAGGASGGPLALSRQAFFLGINDPAGFNPTGAAFDENIFTIFRPWQSRRHDDDASSRARQSIARGEEVFNTKPIVITGVSGLNNERFSNGVTLPDPFIGTCGTCHDSPNAGDHSVKAPLNIGLTDPHVAPYLPVYTLRNIATGDTIDTTDPGRAMVTGKWSDVGRFKGPVLRALAARAPYFHNGSAQTLDEVIDFYVNRFHLVLTPQERADLLAFLRSL